MLGGYLSVDDAGFVTIEDSSTATTEETTFIAYSVADPTGATPIEAGEPALFRSSRTGQWCRLAAVSGGQGLVCDQATADGATELLYTGYSLEAAGQELVSDGSALLLEGGAIADGDPNLVFVPSRECRAVALPSLPAGWLRGWLAGCVAVTRQGVTRAAGCTVPITRQGAGVGRPHRDRYRVAAGAG